MFIVEIEKTKLIKSLHDGLNQIGNFCDGAREIDGAGFNKYDTANAKEICLASTATWNSVKSMLYYVSKYKRQLPSSFVMPSNKDLWNEFVANQNKVNYNGEIVKVEKKADFVKAVYKDKFIDITFQQAEKNKWNQIKETLSSFSKRRFNGETRSWNVFLQDNEITKFKNFVGDYSVEIDKNTEFYLNSFSIQEEKKEIEKKSIFDNSKFLKTAYPFQIEGSNFILENKKCIVADDMGCISGNALISINRGKNGYKIKMSELYNLFHGIDKKSSFDKTTPIYARTLIGEHFYLRQIENVIYKGKKQTMTITLDDNKTLDLTPDHKVRTKDGWVEAQNLKIDDLVYCNGENGCKLCGDKNVITYKHAKFIGYCKQCVYRQKRNNHVKNANYKKRDGYNYIRANLQYHPNKPKTEGIPEHRLIMEAHLNGYSLNEWLEIIKTNSFQEWHSFIERDKEVHHINGIKDDNRIENLEVLTSSEHKKEHNTYTRFSNSNAKLVKIKEIKNGDIIDVYDITVKESHNFIANGIVVHNCGKTAQALQAFVQADTFPVLIVCPATLKYNWLKEIEKHYPNLNKSISVINTTKGKKYNMDFNSDIVIINYDILEKCKEELMKIKWKFIINDESHYIKNIKAKRTKALMDISNVSKAEYHVLMTGTPILNRPKELVTQLQMIDQLHKISENEFMFKLRYCDGKKTDFGWNFDGSSNEKELNTKLKQIMIRRLKEDVLTDLPSKIVQEVFLDIDNMKKYSDKELEFALLIEKELADLSKNYLIDNSFSTLEEINKLSGSEVIQILKDVDEEQYNYYLKQLSNSAIHLTRLTQLKKILAHGKLKQAKEFIDNIISEEKLVVFANHIEIQQELHKMYPNALKIDSQTSMAKRQEIVDKFQSDENEKLIILSLMSCNAGITLTSASKMVMMEYLWQPQLMIQAQDRIYRIGTKNTVNIYNLIANDTIESEEIYPLLMSKLDVATKILDGEQIDSETNEVFSFTKKFIENKILAKSKK